MKRRHLLALAGGTAIALPAHAQKVPRIGVLIAGDPEPGWTQLRKALADLGYVEGRTVAYELRAGGSDRGTLDGYAAAMVAANPDLIITLLTPALTATLARTSTIPVVFYSAAPEAGHVSNIARPGANATGAYSPSSTVAGKSLQLFHQARPATRSVAILLNDLDPFHVPLQRDVEAAAGAEQIEAVPILIKSPNELPQAFETTARRGVDVVLVQPSLGLEKAAALAIAHRQPAISFRREFVEAGGLLSYGADQVELYRSVARQADRILKGARPSDLPVLQTSRFELVINQKTARILGFVFPPLFLATVDEVIE